MRNILNDEIDGVLCHDRYIIVNLFMHSSPLLLTRVQAMQYLFTTLSDTFYHFGHRWKPFYHPLCTFVSVDEHIELSSSSSLIFKSAANIALNSDTHVIAHFSRYDLGVVITVLFACLSSIASLMRGDFQFPNIESCCFTLQACKR